MIRDKSSGTFEAYQWLQRNQRLFQKPVLGPVALALEAGEPLYARYLEQALGEHLMAFIPQTREDRATFLDRCPAHGLRVYFTPEETGELQRPADPEQARPLRPLLTGLTRTS